ncbi:hypothetical protein LPJ72_002143 [Coemansia sp. Benny D160-2]|nr:hypothetical protein LPJ72_002143 [Coemansia sp. Benny D160-2]
MTHTSGSSGEATRVVRGYLPADYYTAHRVFKAKAPTLEACKYPNKIDIDSQRSYAIVAVGKQPHNNWRLLLHSVFAWMSIHSYIGVRVTEAISTTRAAEVTGNVAVEAFEAPERTYAMVVFRAATAGDERTDRMMRSRGYSVRHGPCPPPTTALLCGSGVALQSVWQWLSLHRGRLACLVDAPQLQGTVAIAARTDTPRRRISRDSSRGSMDSMLPAYEPHADAPPAYSEADAPQLLPQDRSQSGSDCSRSNSTDSQCAAVALHQRSDSSRIVIAIGGRMRRIRLWRLLRR